MQRRYFRPPEFTPGGCGKYMGAENNLSLVGAMLSLQARRFWTALLRIIPPRGRNVLSPQSIAGTS
jgi:hypothetical protein